VRYRLSVQWDMKRIFAALLCISLAGPALAGWDEGVAAYTRGDFEAAFREWRPLANQGNVNAQNFLGILYRDGQGVPQNYAEAVKWFRKGAEKNHAGAQFNLGGMYFNGWGVPQDYTMVVKWYSRAALQAYPKAQNHLCLMYRDGRGVPRDYAEAVRLFRNAADQGHAGAQFNFGNMCLNGWGVPQDFVRAHMWFNLAAARNLLSETEKRDIAVKARDQVAMKMTPVQIALAQKLAREWQVEFEKKKSGG